MNYCKRKTLDTQFTNAEILMWVHVHAYMVHQNLHQLNIIMNMLLLTGQLLFFQITDCNLG